MSAEAFVRHVFDLLALAVDRFHRRHAETKLPATVSIFLPCRAYKGSFVVPSITDWDMEKLGADDEVEVASFHLVDVFGEHVGNCIVPVRSLSSRTNWTAETIWGDADVVCSRD